MWSASHHPFATVRRVLQIKMKFELYKCHCLKNNLVLQCRRELYGAKRFRIALNIEKLCFRETNIFDVFDFKKCNDLYLNIKFSTANQQTMKMKIWWRLSLSYLLLKTV